MLDQLQVVKRMQRRKTPQPTRMNLVAVGNVGVGKTNLVTYFAHGQRPDEFVPVIIENYTKEHIVDGMPIETTLWDTVGQEVCEHTRISPYDGANVVLICFAVDDLTSFQDAQGRWVSEVGRFAPQALGLLVGCKQDLREDKWTSEHLQRRGQRFVTTEEATKVAQEIGMKGYLECSALRGMGVAEVFSQAVRVVWASSSKGTKGSHTSKCVIC